jgi:glycosyltransferase involved in cell wall biosynthesis
MTATSVHTFVILAHEKSSYIEACIQSLLSQTMKSEILLSTSTPSSFLQNLSVKYGIPLIINPERGGISSDWSFAFKNCKTKYLTLAHQDDVYSPEYTRECVLSADAVENSLVTFTDYIEFFDDGPKLWTLRLVVKRLILKVFFWGDNKCSTVLAKKNMLRFGNPVCCPTVMFNKDNVGCFEFDRAFFMNLDWEAMFRLAEAAGAFVYVKNTLLTRRIHKNSATAAALANKKRQYEDRIMLARGLPRFITRILVGLYAVNYGLDKNEKY